MTGSKGHQTTKYISPMEPKPHWRTRKDGRLGLNPGFPPLLWQRLRKLFAGIKKRCSNPTHKNHNIYGGLEIGFTDSADFAVYMMSLPNYSDTSSVDRVDGRRGYVKGNLRWATQQDQCRNTRRTFTLPSGEPLISAVERLNATDFMPIIRVWFKRGGVNNDEDILRIKNRNIARRVREQVIKSLLKLRPDYCYESIRAWLKDGLTPEQIAGRKKWEGCGAYQRKDN